MSERWLPVVGYEDLYEVSDSGRVRGLGRFVKAKLGSRRWQKSVILSPGISGNGYYTVRLTRNATGKSYAVHRLVLQAFMGPCPDGMEGCHNNGIATDNQLENLRWDTSRANSLDQFKHGTQRNAFKTHCIHGHELTPENTYLYGVARNGSKRMCKTCNFNRTALYRNRKARTA